MLGVEEYPLKVAKVTGKPLSFTKEDACGIYFTHNDLLVIMAMIENHNIFSILVDEESQESV